LKLNIGQYHYLWWAFQYVFPTHVGVNRASTAFGRDTNQENAGPIRLKYLSFNLFELTHFKNGPGVAMATTRLIKLNPAFASGYDFPEGTFGWVRIMPLGFSFDNSNPT